MVEDEGASPSSDPFLPPGSLFCHCLGHCPPQNYNNGSSSSSSTCVAKPGAKCFAAVEEVLDLETNDLVMERTFGCMPPEEDGGLFQCKGHLVPHLNPTSIACCSDGNYCNQALTPMYTTPTSDDDDMLGRLDQEDESLAASSGINGFLHSLDEGTAIALLVSLTFCLIIIILVIAFVYLRYKRREDRRQKYVRAAQKDPDSFVKMHPGTLSDLIEQSSGSGSGLPLLVQRTIAKQIQMDRSIGKGRYGEVWLAKWRGEDIAVKVFFTTDEGSWFRETEIYQTVLMRHENILGFIAADIKGSGSWTQMLLLTDYHELGSLHDFLQQNTVDEEELLRLCQSISAGLCHLHTEIHGSRGKPAIAHRDIKTRNVLVKKDGTCAIADFGLAVRFDSEKNEIDVGAPNPRVGTSRYMAPEALDQSLNTSSFTAFLQADMYSVGLVMWEVARRTVTGEKTLSVDAYQLPYFEWVNPDPSFEDMHSVVCVKGIRPTPCPRWKTSSGLMAFSQLLTECWHANPSARLSGLRVKKTLTTLLNNEVQGSNSSMVKIV